MARLFISYKREEQDYAFAIRQWLMDSQDWAPEEIFIDRDKLRAGVEWAERIFAEAEKSEVMLFMASEASLQPDSFCYKELQRARGVTLAVTIKGLSPDDERLRAALPHGADARQITALDGQPKDAFKFVSPIDGSTGAIGLNRPQVESIGQMLRDLGVAPNSFTWTARPEGPYPGLAALQEGDEALFFGRDLEIRDCIRVVEEIRQSVSDKALLIQAPSGAGKSSFLRAGLWRRLRRHAGFTPLAIIRTRQAALFHESWGLAAGLARPEANRLQLAVSEIETRIKDNLPGLLAEIADADASGESGRRTLLLGIDQAEEMAALNSAEDAELQQLLTAINDAPKALNIRFILTARDDSIDATIKRLEAAGIDQEAVRNFRLHRMPHARFTEVIRGPAASARRSGYPLNLDDALTVALSTSAAESLGEVGDALPILALALQRLMKKHRAPDGRITLKSEKAAEFLSAAIEDAARDAMSAVDADETALRRLFIPRLVTWDPRAGEAGSAKRQVATSADLFGGDRKSLEQLAEALVDQRLLTKTSTRAGTVYEVAHEALLRAQPLGDLIKGLRAKFVRAEFLTMEAREWLESGRDAERRARTGERLREAQELFRDPDFGAALSQPELCMSEYLDSCAEKDRQEEMYREQYEKSQLASYVGQEIRETKPKPTGRGRVYISFSRSDFAAAEELRNDLSAAGFDVTVDVADIRAGEDWNSRLVELIASADYVLFLMSPDWATSQICNWEAEQATNLNKRLVPVVIRELGGVSVPSALQALNYVFMTDEGDKQRSLNVLIEILSVDVEWLREHTRLGELAQRWEASGKQPDLLARGSALDSLKSWRDARPINAPDLTSAQRAYLQESEEEELRRMSADRQRVEELEAALLHAEAAEQQRAAASRRVVRRTVAGLAASLLFAVVAGGAAYSAFIQRSVAQQQAALAMRSEQEALRQRDQTSRIQSQFLADLAVQQILSGDTTEGALLALEALPNSKSRIASRRDRPFVTEAESALRRALSKTGVRLAIRPTTRAFFRSSISPDGRRAIAALDEASLQVFDIETGKRTATLKGHKNTVLSATFSPDATQILTAAFDNTARLWRSDTGVQLTVLEGHTARVLSTAFSPDGSRVLTASEDRTARIWDASSGKQLFVLKGHTAAVSVAAFSPDSKRILTASWDNSARIWDGNTGAQIATLKGHRGWVTTASFSPDGRMILTASRDGTGRLWASRNGEAIAVLEGHEADVTTAQFSPDGVRVITSSDDSTTRLWDARTGQSLAVLHGHNGAVLSASFSPDGSRILTGSRDGTTRVWRIQQSGSVVGEELLRSDGKTIVAVAFTPDGRLYITSSDDGTVRVWAPESEIPNVEFTQELVEYAKSRLGECLSRTQRQKYFLAPEPPRWCITGAKFENEADPAQWKSLPPYDSKAWRDWLVTKDRGELQPLPSPAQ